MTDKPTPTPTEIIALAATEGVRVRTGAVAIKFAHAVLAKWGTPAPVVVGEVAEHYRNAIASACEGWTMPDGLRKHLETALWSPPTPQPTQPQAGAVTDAQVLAAVRVVSPGLIRHGLQPLPNDGANTAAQMRKEADTARTMLDAAFSAAQPVAREPLTDWQIQDLLLCGNPTDEEKRLIRIGLDAANGIKGGQHG